MIHKHVTARTLGVVRIWIFALWMWEVAWDPFQQLAAIPRAVFVPIGLLNLLPDAVWSWILSVPFLIGFKSVLLAFLVLSMVGVRPYHPIALTTALLLTVEQSFIRSIGFVNHKQIALLFAVYVLAVFPAVDGMAWPRRKKVQVSSTYSLAMVSMTLVMLLAYSSIAAFRIAHSSPDVFMGSMRYNIAVNILPDSGYGWEFGKWVLERPWLLLLINVGFIGTTVFELLSPLCLVFQRFRWVWLAVIVPFHFSTLFLMNIFFSENLLLMMVLLIDLDYWLAKIPDWNGNLVKQRVRMLIRT